MDTTSKEFLAVCRECDLKTREDRNILREGFAAFSGTSRKPKTRQEELERQFRANRFWDSLSIAISSEDLVFDNLMRAVAMCTDISHKQLESSRITAAKVSDREDEFNAFSNLADSCLQYYENQTGEKYDLAKLETGIFPEM